MHSHVASVATRVILFRIGRHLRRRARDRLRCSACPTKGNLLPRVDRISVAERGCCCESEPGDAADRRGIQSIRTRRRLDGDVRREATAWEPENNHRHGSRISDPQVRTACLGIESQGRLRLYRIFGNGRDLSGVDIYCNGQNHACESRAKPTMHRDRQCSSTACAELYKRAHHCDTKPRIPHRRCLHAEIGKFFTYSNTKRMNGRKMHAVTVGKGVAVKRRPRKWLY